MRGLQKLQHNDGLFGRGRLFGRKTLFVRRRGRRPARACRTRRGKRGNPIRGQNLPRLRRGLQGRGSGQQRQNKGNQEKSHSGEFKAGGLPDTSSRHRKGAGNLSCNRKASVKKRRGAVFRHRLRRPFYRRWLVQRSVCPSKRRAVSYPSGDNRRRNGQARSGLAVKDVRKTRNPPQTGHGG